MHSCTTGQLCAEVAQAVDILSGKPDILSGRWLRKQICLLLTDRIVLPVLRTRPLPGGPPVPV
eukprot:4055557-Prorocentrum_lima.AAC.1